MREIKFRAWDSVEKRMWSHYEIDDSDKDGIVLWGGLFNGSEKMDLMQYTGLKDKNGKEIYDGDIVSFEDFYIGDHRNVGGNGFVKWLEDGWCVIAFGDYQACLWDMVNNYSAEILGNVHENYELLS